MRKTQIYLNSQGGLDVEPTITYKSHLR